MSDILSALTTLYPDQVWLELSPFQLEQTGLSQQEYSYDVARWTAFKNCLALDAFLAWLKAESGVTDQPEVWPSRDDLSSIWEMVNGTAIQLGETRIVLIPHEGIDINEFEVQAEWVDIPSWVADYYLAIQVNPDDCWMRVWGYATHKKLKQAGQYNSIRRTYSLGREELIEDVNVMWVARELGRDQRAVVKPLPTLSPAQAERLLERLSQKTLYSPRLEVPFEQWAGLLDNDRWRQDLYNRRLGRLAPVAAPSQVRVNLSQWFQHIYETGWQTLEEVLSTLGTPEAKLASGSRSAGHSNEIHSDYLEEISALIDQLSSGQDEHKRQQAAKRLGEVGTGNSNAIAALINLLRTSQDDETLWTAVESLWQIDPGNPASGVSRARLIDLGMQLVGHTVALAVAIIKKADQKVNVLLQVYSTGNEAYLPINLKLILLHESGQILREITARRADIYIQLKLSGQLGEQFSVRVALGDDSLTEDFVL